MLLFSTFSIFPLIIKPLLIKVADMVGVIRATFADRNAKRINDNLYKEEKIRRLQRFYHPKCPCRLKIQSRTPAGYDIQKKREPHFCNSLIFKWCHRESNQGHKDFQSFALPTEL